MTLTDRSALLRAIRDPTLDEHIRALLGKRLDQSGATFHVAEVGDTVTDAELAIGWPLIDEGMPQWEWALRHTGGVVELTFILSDDGPAEVLIVPDHSGIDPKLRDLCRQHA